VFLCASKAYLAPVAVGSTVSLQDKGKGSNKETAVKIHEMRPAIKCRNLSGAFPPPKVYNARHTKSVHTLECHACQEGRRRTMDRRPGPVCFPMKFSSSNLLP